MQIDCRTSLAGKDVEQGLEEKYVDYLTRLKNIQSDKNLILLYIKIKQNDLILKI